MTRRTSDCLDSHFPTNKGPKYLQYSNSLNDTFCVLYSCSELCPQCFNTFIFITIFKQNLFIDLFWFVGFPASFFPELYQANCPGLSQVCQKRSFQSIAKSSMSLKWIAMNKSESHALEKN